MTQEQKEQYLNEVRNFEEELLNEINLREKAIETNSKNSKDLVAKHFQKSISFMNLQAGRIENNSKIYYEPRVYNYCVETKPKTEE